MNDIKYNCEFCCRTFNTRNLLERHQTEARYCLELQGKIDPKKKEKYSFKCHGCNRDISTKQSLSNHINNCKYVKDKKITELEDVIEDLKNKLLESQTENKIYKDSQECLKEIAKQPKIQNNSKIQTNNNINNKYFYLTPLNLTQEIIKQKIDEHFTEKHLIEGQKGVAIFTHDNLLLDDDNNLKYLCGDASRLLFYYKNKDGTIEKDPKGTNLTKMIVEDVISKSHSMVMNILDDDKVEMLEKLDYQNIFYDIKHLRDDNGKFISNLSLLVSKKIKNQFIK